MAYDISTVAAAMDQKIMQLEHISTNLANAVTPGFKAEHLLVLNSLQQGSKPGESASSLTSLVVVVLPPCTERTRRAALPPTVLRRRRAADYTRA